MTAEALFAWARERHSITLKRAAGLPKPWTDDPILRAYRFCNVYRELDAVTQWITREWRTPHADDPDLWFAMVAARYVNEPGTLERVGFPVPWNRERFVAGFAARRIAGERCFSPAYMISTNGTAALSKDAYIADYVLGPLWTQREILRPRAGDTLNSYHVILGGLFGLASFLAAQVVADLKYVRPLLDASDWWTFAASGPGSKRGLNRVLGRRVDAPWREDEWRMELARLREELLPMFERTGMPTPHAQDIQNCLCEFDKYQRALLGEGRPKQKFNGGGV